MGEIEQFATLIPIKKMDRAIKFYTKVLGAKVVARMEGDMSDFWAALKVGGSDVWFVSPSQREKRKLAYHAFVVSDIKSFVAKLQKADVDFAKAEKVSKKTKIVGPIAYDDGGASAYFWDSEGNLLMIWENL